ncbi:disulfide bond formation protein B [Thauera sp. Sel9]|uniref:disulfide bond formation protein B n=1 Tax=Thauera sp. Sel9 TaxID=2974299 RepID=UPI0021E1A78B|nr:disulfide bond formation protein B [Thauera sp. Sel9]MCV2218420.1 disulfide bond formation protein B [Thauera sp. Sel9]
MRPSFPPCLPHPAQIQCHAAPGLLAPLPQRHHDGERRCARRRLRERFVEHGPSPVQRKTLSSGRWIPLAILECCLVALAVAPVSQHPCGMQPCPWCVPQRAVSLAIAIAAVFAASWLKVQVFYASGKVRRQAPFW